MSKRIQIRFSKDEYEFLVKKSLDEGYDDINEWIRCFLLGSTESNLCKIYNSILEYINKKRYMKFTFGDIVNIVSPDLKQKERQKLGKKFANENLSKLNISKTNLHSKNGSPIYIKGG